MIPDSLELPRSLNGWLGLSGGGEQGDEEWGAELAGTQGFILKLKNKMRIEKFEDLLWNDYEDQEGR